MLADDLGELKAIDLGHADVHEHNCDVILEQFLQGLLGRRSFDQVFAQIRQDRFVSQQFTRLVVDHQDVHALLGGGFLRRFTTRIGDYFCAQTYAHRCSHIRNADSNCSVFTGLARYSEAPASRHFSRSPFIALAVRAMIGNRRNDGFCRITCIAAAPSISGIMMSMRTIATSGVDSNIEMASLPVPAVSTAMPRRSSTLLRAKMLRMSSSTTRTFLPTSASSDRWRRSSIFCFSWGRSATTRCRKSAVSSSSLSGDSTPL